VFRIALFILALAATPSGTFALTDQAATEASFRNWLVSDVWPRARRAGVSRTTFDAAMSGVRIDWELPGLDLPTDGPRRQKQSEFDTPGRYFRAETLEDLTRIGRRMATEHARALSRAERETGVPARIVLAIWGRESGFGRVPTVYDAYEVLATRAYFGPGTDYFEGELVAALRIAQAGTTSRRLTSSWAGALGQPQFMPTSYLAHAVDGDGDGRPDIWTSEADSIASIAGFLADHGWVPGRDWGYEVRVPSALSCTLEGQNGSRSISEWERMGITRVSDQPFPKAERGQDASLLMPAGRLGPAFLVTPNFYVLKDYNRSDLYALFIGNTADRIAFGMGDFKGRWSRVDSLHRSDVSAMQEALGRRGFDTGGSDGLAGVKTRRAIGQWQERSGRRATCYPDAGLKAALVR